VTTTSASARARRSSAAPAEILRAAEALLLAEGGAGLSIRKLEERCGYSAPTIYHHFGDKRGLLDAVLEARFRAVYRLMRRIPRGDDPARYLRRMARAFVRFALANPDHYRLLGAASGGASPAVPSAEAARELVKGALVDLAREGTLWTDDVDAAFEVTWAMLHGLISLRIEQPQHAFAPNLTELALDTVEAGLLRRRDGRR
jgi:AcrR family transcriptional regulator